MEMTILPLPLYHPGSKCFPSLPSATFCAATLVAPALGPGRSPASAPSAWSCSPTGFRAPQPDRRAVPASRLPREQGAPAGAGRLQPPRAHAAPVDAGRSRRVRTCPAGPGRRRRVRRESHLPPSLQPPLFHPSSARVWARGREEQVIY